jgi:competence protein ComGC
MVKGRESRVEGQTQAIALRSYSGPRPSTLDPRLALDPRPARRAVTLIELLIVLLIITILAGLILGVAAVAGETARESQSKHTVLRLHKLLTEHYETYKTRRVDVRDAVKAGIQKLLDTRQISPTEAGKLRAQARLHALRELMLLEMPDRWSNVLLLAAPPKGGVTVQPLYPFFLDVSSTGTGRTPLSSIYLRRYLQLRPTTQNEGAECLYLIVTLACGEGEARSQFGEDSIGDTDGDGAYEFLDGWGHPIEFLRWAPGFNSQVQINGNDLGLTPKENPKWATAAASDHDPFDLYRVDPFAFRLVPLIYSPGRDETLGIRSAPKYLAHQGLNKRELDDVPQPDEWRIILPWAPINDPDSSTSQPIFLGSVIPDGGATDNIHNHLLGRR